MTDRELLEKAAKAAGITLKFPHDPATYEPIDCVPPRRTDTWENWNPLEDDGDALRLAVGLRMNINIYAQGAEADCDSLESTAKEGGDPYAAARRAIVRAAAAIGDAK